MKTNVYTKQKSNKENDKFEIIQIAQLNIKKLSERIHDKASDDKIIIKPKNNDFVPDWLMF